MNLYCIYLLSNMHVMQPDTFHACKLVTNAQEPETIEQKDHKSYQARKNMREALAYPILQHIMEQKEQQLQQPAQTLMQAYQHGITIRF